LSRVWGGVFSAPFAAGAAAALALGSLVTGGYVFYVHGLLVAAVGEPLLVLGLRVALAGLGVALLLASLSRRRGLASLPGWGRLGPGAAGVLAGFASAALLLVGIYGAASTPVLAAYWAVAGVPLAAGLGRRRGLYVLAAALLLSSSLAVALLYSPVAAAGHVEAVRLGAPIQVSGLYRFVPLMTAYVYASDRIQVATHRIYPGDSYVYYQGNHSVYNWLIEPEGLWNRLTKTPIGAVFVYGDAYPPRVVVLERRLRWGLRNARLGPLYVDTLERRVILASGLRYEPVMEDNMEVVRGGRLYVVIPLLSWRRGLLYSLPVLHGYAVVGEDGSIRVVEGPGLLGDPVLQGLPLLPERAARSWAEAYRYHVGLVDYYLYHNTYVIRDVGTNPQPYLERGPGGRLYWVFVAEPPGETHSAKYILYVDAGAGEPRLLVYELPRPAIGVSMAASYVKQAHPTYDWSQLALEEPIPTLLRGRLYWKITVTTRDHRGLVSVDLLDASTGEVSSFQPRPALSSLDVLKALLRGGGAPGRPSPLEEVRRMRKEIAEIERRLHQLDEQLRRLEEALAANTTSRR